MWPQRWRWLLVVAKLGIVSLSPNSSFNFSNIFKTNSSVLSTLYSLAFKFGFLGGSDGKEPACNAWVQSLGQEDPLEKRMATYFSILAWRIPYSEEHGKLQSMGSQRVRHDGETNTFTFIGSLDRGLAFLLGWLSPTSWSPAGGAELEGGIPGGSPWLGGGGGAAPWHGEPLERMSQGDPLGLGCAGGIHGGDTPLLVLALSQG